LAVNDSTNVSGTLSDNNSNGTDLFKGQVTINPGGTWDFSGNDSPEFRGGLKYNGASFNSGAGIYEFTTNNQDLSGSNQIVFDASIDVNTITLKIKQISGVKSTGALTSTGGNWVNDVNSILRYDKVSPVNTIMGGNLDASANGNTVIYGGSGTQKISPNSDYYNLILKVPEPNQAFRISTFCMI